MLGLIVLELVPGVKSEDTQWISPMTPGPFLADEEAIAIAIAIEGAFQRQETV